ncbi:glucosamine-6-phosphate deaminase [Neobacillus terrae]|uniref:glucosamine-6-phosphate deaminase n=1 Tax=Neobacillus terrae TaxID=3034837 RepID=UPI001407A9B3|nr:glucosamine-6-phosphate deaminase [Neobacillus terrae]
MDVIEVSNYEEMSQKAANIVIETIKENVRTLLGLATGSTPKGMYQVLIDDHKKNKTSYQEVRTVNLDEYVGLAPSDPNSYHFFMRENLFDSIDIPLESTHIPNGLAENLQNECTRYDSLISDLGGIDLQILGIGINGHIGFNEPGTSFDSKTHIVSLTESTRQANARFFQSIEEVPTKAITMGINTIFQSKKIILLASGAQKADAIKKLLEGKVDKDFPASALCPHSNVTLIADTEALSKVEEVNSC